MQEELEAIQPHLTAASKEVIFSFLSFKHS